MNLIYTNIIANRENEVETIFIKHTHTYRTCANVSPCVCKVACAHLCSCWERNIPCLISLHIICWGKVAHWAQSLSVWLVLLYSSGNPYILWKALGYLWPFRLLRISMGPRDPNSVPPHLQGKCINSWVKFPVTLNLSLAQDDDKVCKEANV